MNEFNLFDEHIKIEDFKKNISIENLNNFIKNNKLFINLHNLEFNELNKDIFNKYIELFIDEENIDNTYFMQLENYINYFDENSFQSIDDITEIDSSFYAKNKIKEYLFMVNFLSDFYKSKYKQKKEYNKNAIDSKRININLKKTYTSEEDIVSIFSLNKIEYIPIEFDFQTVSTTDTYDYQIKNIKINNLNKISLNLYEKKEYIDSFIKLFNKIKFKDFNDLNKNIDYYYGVLQSYKYKYYDILLNYNIIQVYYVYIKIKGQNENSNLVKYQEIFKLLEIFNIVLLNNELKFNQLDVIMNTVDKLDSKAESEKIEDAKYSMNKLKHINYNLLQNQDYIRNNYKQIEVTQKDINTNTNKIIVISILLVLTFITFTISINYYSLNTSKILSVIIISIIVIVILVNNYIIKNKTYENFDLVEETTKTEDVTDKIVEILGSDTGSLSDVYKEIDDLNTRYNAANHSYDNLNELTDLSQEYERKIDLTDGYLSQSEEEERRIGSIKDAYDKLIRDEVVVSEALYLNIQQSRGQLTNLDTQYKNLQEQQNNLIGEKTAMEIKIAAATANATAAETQLSSKMKQVSELNGLVQDYGDINTKLRNLMKEKDDIKDSKLKKIDEINAINTRLITEIDEITKTSSEQNTEIGTYNTALAYLLSEIDTLDRQKIHFDQQTTIEDAILIQLDSDIKSRYANYSDALSKVGAQTAKIVKLTKMIKNGDMAVQQLAKKIIDLENKNKIRAEESKQLAIKAAEEAKIALNLLDQKLTKINEYIQNKPKSRKYKLKLNLNFGIAGEVNTAKRYNFKNEILLELSRLLLVPLNRFKIEDIEEGSINIILIFYPSRTYDNRDLSSEQLISKLEEIFKSDKVNNKLLNTKYLKFTMKISQLNDNSVIIDGTTTDLDTSKYLNTNNIISKINNIFIKNSVIIKNIETIITQLENVKRNPNTYYNEINPKLNLEVKKYAEKDLKINNNQYILKSKTDILVHDYINKNYIYKYLSYITLLFALLFLSYSYLNNYMLVIYIISVIIFLLLLFNLYIDIYKNVRRKSKKQYWTKPNKI